MGLTKTPLAMHQFAAPMTQVATDGAIVELFLEPGFYKLIGILHKFLILVALDQ
jgi:hypothetical protein